MHICLKPALLAQGEDESWIFVDNGSTPPYLLALLRHAEECLMSCVKEAGADSYIKIDTREFGRIVEQKLPLYLAITAKLVQRFDKLDALLEQLQATARLLISQATQQNSDLLHPEDACIPEPFLEMKNATLSSFLMQFGGASVTTPVSVEFPLLEGDEEAEPSIIIDKSLPPNPGIYQKLPAPHKRILFASGIDVDKMQARFRESPSLINQRFTSTLSYIVDDNQLLTDVALAALALPRQPHRALIETRHDKNGYFKEYLVSLQGLNEAEITELQRKENDQQIPLI